MKSLFVTIAMLASLAAAAQDNGVAGRYALHNVPNARSDMLLKPDGSFDWQMAYGDIEQTAKGNWSADNAHVTLTARHQGTPNFRLFTEAEYKYVRDAKPGTWVAVLELPYVGPLPDIEVAFESASGKTVTAISPHNGYAVIKMEDSEQWKRVGLRKKGAAVDYQWIDVPPARAAARLTGFTVTNIETVMPAPFETLVLTRNGAELLWEPEMGGTGVYRKK